MNKKLFLLALPTLMVLSGCAGVNAAPKANLMAEDNLAHEEIFGEAIEAGELGLKKQAPRRLADLKTWDGGFVKVGYQINYKAADDTLSIRFVAAIKNAGVTALWHRGLAQPNGYQGAEVTTGNWKFKFDEYGNDTVGKESTKYYTSLTDGTDTISTEAGEFAGYAGFAIYTVTGIPYTTYKDSYFAAYVILTDESDSENVVKSKAQAIKIERNGSSSKNRFFFDPDYTDKHFFEGTINGVVRNGSDNSTHALLVADEDAGDGYDAKYENVALKTTDSFGSFYYNKHSTFQFFGKSTFFGDSSELLTSSALAEYNAPKADGNYTLFVNQGGSANHVTTYKIGADQVYTLDSIPNWVVPDCTLFLGYADVNDDWHWSSTALSVVGSTGTFTLPNNILRFMLVRCYTGTTEPNWEEHGNALGRIYNKTIDFGVSMGYFTFGCGESVWSNY